MASSFKTQDIFGSGPHRFQVGRRGSFVLSDAQIASPGPNTYPVGVQELDITVRGRLVATSEAGLWSVRDAVVAMLINPPTAGTLVDHTGRSWADVSFIRYEEAEVRDRGRVWSVGYTATFRRFNVLP
jgi:hypothetical protein